MEKKRSSEEKIKKMQELGIFEKWKVNTDARTRELYSRYDFTENYIIPTEKKAYIVLRRIRVPVRYDRVIIHIRKSPGRTIILVRNS